MRHRCLEDLSLCRHNDVAVWARRRAEHTISYVDEDGTCALAPRET